jgi:copper chaperone NosL
MKNLPGPLVILAILIACSTKPEPLLFGKDPCFTCKMTLMDTKFGAEIVSRKGKVYKFDDMNCMIEFYHSGYEPAENIAQLLVVDYAKPGTLINAKTAYYIYSEAIHSPMASNVAAYSSGEELANYNKDLNGKTLGWEELLVQLK